MTIDLQRLLRGEGGTPYNGRYGEVPPERGTFFRLQVYRRVGISRAEVYERVGKSVICHNNIVFLVNISSGNTVLP